MATMPDTNAGTHLPNSPGVQLNNVTNGRNTHTQAIPPAAATAAPMSLEAQKLDNRDPKLRLAGMDPSQLTISLSSTPKPLPAPETLVFGTTTSDHMMIMSFDPASGWSAPAIRPYGPLSLDPCSSCFQYCTNLFEGMKAYLGPDGKPRLFRPDMNMARMARSTARLALPEFDTAALLTLIKKLVLIEARWIPYQSGYSLYVRPTLIGTRPALGVAASTHAMLYIILSPTGPYFPPSLTTPRKRNWISLFASSRNVRAWPGGTGAYKLGLNYAPCFEPQREAAKLGYSQILWLLPIDTETGKEWLITECGQMNFMCVIKRDDGGIELVTPPLDGTILPGVTRDSILILAGNHNKGSPLPGLSANVNIHVREAPMYMSHLVRWEQEGRLLEAFGSGTAAILAGIRRVGWEGKDIMFGASMEDELKEEERDVNGLGPVGRVLYSRIVEIQEGRVEGHEWSVSCVE